MRDRAVWSSLTGAVVLAAAAVGILVVGSSSPPFAARADAATVLAGLVAAKEPVSIDSQYSEGHGTRFDGVTTLDGTPVMAFRFDSDMFRNVVLRSRDSTGAAIEIRASQLSLSGNIVEYATTLDGNLYGLLPVNFSAQFPPPIMVPTLIGTSVHTDVLWVRADTLQAQGLNLEAVPS